MIAPFLDIFGCARQLERAQSSLLELPSVADIIQNAPLVRPISLAEFDKKNAQIVLPFFRVTVILQFLTVKIVQGSAIKFTLIAEPQSILCKNDLI